MRATPVMSDAYATVVPTAPAPMIATLAVCQGSCGRLVAPPAAMLVMPALPVIGWSSAGHPPDVLAKAAGADVVLGLVVVVVLGGLVVPFVVVVVVELDVVRVVVVDVVEGGVVLEVVDGGGGGVVLVVAGGVVAGLELDGLGGGAAAEVGAELLVAATVGVVAGCCTGPAGTEPLESGLGVTPSR